MNNIMKKIKQLCQNKRKLNAEKYINKLKDNLQSSGSPEQVYIRYGIIQGALDMAIMMDIICDYDYYKEQTNEVDKIAETLLDKLMEE